MNNAQKAKAQQYFDSYPEANVIFETSDGQVFLDKNQHDAVNHQRRLTEVNKEARMQAFYKKDLNRKTDEELEEEREEEEIEEEVEEEIEEEEEKGDLIVDGNEVIAGDEESQKVVDEAAAVGETVAIPAESITETNNPETSNEESSAAIEAKPEQVRSNGRGRGRNNNKA